MDEKQKFRIYFKLNLSVVLAVLSIIIAIIVFQFISDKRKPAEIHNSELTFWILNTNQNQNDKFKAIRKIFAQFGYREVNGSQEHWDILWSNELPFDEFTDGLPNCAPRQRINHIPGIIFLSSKLYLGTSVQSRYIPVSFELPRLKNEFIYFQKNNPNRKYIIKNIEGGGVKMMDTKKVNFNLGNKK